MKDRGLLLVMSFCLFAGAIFGFAFANMGPCQPANNDCARSWLSATSGWAAVIAAGFTVFVINKQIRESNRQHLEQMSFQASERLLLAKQINSGTWPAFGTVKQIFVSMEEVTKPRSRERLASEVGAAKFALDRLQEAQIPEKRLQFQGNLPPVRARADVCLKQYVASAESILRLPDEKFDTVDCQNDIGVLMGEIILAHRDLEGLVRETDSFQKKWKHLDRN